MTDELAAVILAAGQGTRMRSKLPKVLHRLAGQPMVQYVIDALAPLAPRRTIMVVGHGSPAVQQAVGPAVACVAQEPQLGTGHAVLQARPLLAAWPGDVLVLYGDTPLLRSTTLEALLTSHRQSGATVTMLTAMADDPTGYGRIERGERGEVRAIVEERTATVAQRAIREINSGVYCFRAPSLWAHLAQLRCSEKGEYYLTDLIAMAVREGETVTALVATDSAEAMGINTRVHLAAAEEIIRWRIRRDLMLGGTTLLDPASTYVDVGVRIGQDTVVYPNCLIEGSTVIGDDCVIGPNTYLINAHLGRGCRVLASLIEDSALAEGVTVGPFSHLRNGARVGVGVQIGNFAEIKNSSLGPGTKMHHFSYLGDATVGQGVNVGAGTITCNFNSETQVKSQTIIEDEAALGSDTMLVAPVRIGRRATTGAGSVVTRDLPPESVAYGVPAKVVRKVRKGGA